MAGVAGSKVDLLSHCCLYPAALKELKILFFWTVSCGVSDFAPLAMELVLFIGGRGRQWAASALVVLVHSAEEIKGVNI